MKKTIKYLLWVIIIILIISGTAGFAVYKNLDSILSKQIKKQVAKRSNKFYTIDFENLHFNIADGSLRLENVKLSPDSTQVPKSPKITFSILSKSLFIGNFSMWKLFRTKKLTIDSVLLETPKITLFKPEKKKKKKKHDKAPKIGLPNSSKHIDFVKICKLKIDSGNFVLKNSKNSAVVATLESFRFEIDSLEIVKQNQRKPIKFENINLIAHNFNLLMKNKVNYLKFEKLSTDFKNNTLKIVKFEHVPLYTKYEYAKTIGHQQSRIYLEFPEIELCETDFAGFIETGVLHAGNVNIPTLNMNIYNDKTLPFKGKPVKMPREILRNFPFKLHFDTTKVNKGYVSYEEKPSNGNPASKLYFNKLRANIKNISNTKKAIEKNLSILAHISAKFMNRGKMYIDIDLPMNASSGQHKLKGRISNFSLSRLNKFIGNIAYIRIKSGHLKKLDFDINANYYYAHGNVKMYYNDLKIQLLRRKNKARRREHNVMLSFLANRIVKTNNPTRRKPLRIGEIKYSREKYSSLFAFWSKSILSGVISSVGPKKIVRSRKLKI